MQELILTYPLSRIKRGKASSEGAGSRVLGELAAGIAVCIVLLFTVIYAAVASVNAEYIPSTLILAGTLAIISAVAENRKEEK